MKTNLIIVLVFVVGIVTVCTKINDENTVSQSYYDYSNVDSLIISSIKDSVFPGAVLLIGNSDEIFYEKGYGNFTYDEHSPVVTPNTIYDIASLTKVIATTTAIMICTDRNLFNPDDKVSNFIPEFEQNNKQSITIKNLLLHNSGIPAYKKYYQLNLQADEILDDIYSLELNYQTGSKIVYSDLGMIVLAKVIEKVMGNSFDRFCREEIFIPLGMKHTFFNPPDSLKYRIAPTEGDDHWRMKLIQGEVHDETASLLGGAAGHAGLFSTANDLSKLIQVILNNGKYDDGRLIKEETVKFFTTKHSGNSTRALGWDTKSITGSSAGKYFDTKSFGHTGFTGTSVWIDPVRNLFIVFLSNRVYPTRENKKIIEFRPKLHDAVVESID